MTAASGYCVEGLGVALHGSAALGSGLGLVELITPDPSLYVLRAAPTALVPWMKAGGLPAQPESAPWLRAAEQGRLVLGFG